MLLDGKLGLTFGVWQTGISRIPAEYQEAMNIQMNLRLGDPPLVLVRFKDKLLVIPLKGMSGMWQH